VNDAVRAQSVMASKTNFNNKQRAFKPVVPEILITGMPLWRWTRDGVSLNQAIKAQNCNFILRNHVMVQRCTASYMLHVR